MSDHQPNREPDIGEIAHGHTRALARRVSVLEMKYDGVIDAIYALAKDPLTKNRTAGECVTMMAAAIRKIEHDVAEQHRSTR